MGPALQPRDEVNEGVNDQRPTGLDRLSCILSNERDPHGKHNICAPIGKESHSDFVIDPSFPSSLKSYL